MITKTEAIVLRTVDYGESSLIATLFTRTHGKIAVIARGARKPKSKFAAFLVTGQLLEVVYYMKNTRSVQTLSDASYIVKLNELRTNLQKMAVMVTTLELTSQVIHENEVNEPVFDFLKKMLSWLNDWESVSNNIFPYIQIRLAQLLGIGLQPEVQQKQSVNRFLNIQSGTLSDVQEGGDVVMLTEAQFAFVYKSLHSMSSSIFEMELNSQELRTLIQYLDRYFRFHIEGVKPRKSDKIFGQLLN